MAGRQVTDDGFPANFAGMTKSQLYDIMSQMKVLIEQNRHQARQILIQQPLLTKGLFQAQIMLGMVQPPQAVPNIQPPPSQPTLHAQLPPVQHQSFSGPAVKDQKGPPNSLIPSNMVIPGINTQPQPVPLPLKTPQNPKPHSMPQLNQAPVSQPPQIPITHNHPSSQPLPHHQPQISTAPMHHMPMQPPLPSQPRPASFQHQFPPPQPPQMVGNINYQHGNAPPQHLSQPPPFHASNKPPNMGPSFPHLQVPLQNQPPPQSMYQPGGMQLGTEFNGQGGSSMQVDRGSSWMSGPPENPPLPGPPSLIPGMGTGNQPARPPSLSPEMEKALLQQVMSLTPEQINLLPPEQRNQVLQLQQILRQ